MLGVAIFTVHCHKSMMVVCVNVHSTLYAGCSNIHSSLFHKSMMVMCVNVHSTLYAECSNIHSHSLIFPGEKKTVLYHIYENTSQPIKYIFKK